jgi:hypothetical protein
LATATRQRSGKDIANALARQALSGRQAVYFIPTQPTSLRARSFRNSSPWTCALRAIEDVRCTKVVLAQLQGAKTAANATNFASSDDTDVSD